jgi:hypothetical protein
MSGAKCERPVARYQPPDWYSRNSKMASNARSLRDQSLGVRDRFYKTPVSAENVSDNISSSNLGQISRRLDVRLIEL